MTRSLQGFLEEPLGRNRVPLRAENQKSIVVPVESTARYRYRQFPPWQM
jgi:hypothetical protein